jgi:hypothetical protein
MTQGMQGIIQIDGYLELEAIDLDWFALNCITTGI